MIVLVIVGCGSCSGGSVCVPEDAGDCSDDGSWCDVACGAASESLCVLVCGSAYCSLY